MAGRKLSLGVTTMTAAALAACGDTGTRPADATSELTTSAVLASAVDPGTGDSLLLSDDFNAYKTANKLGTRRGAVALVSGRGGSGNAVRFTYGNTFDNYLQRTVPAHGDLTVRFWYRASAGAAPTSGGRTPSGLPWLSALDAAGARYTFAVSSARASSLPAGVTANGGLEFTSTDASSAAEPKPFPQNVAKTPRFGTTNDGQWHQYAARLVTGAKGYEQVWVDGTLVLDTKPFAYAHSASGVTTLRFPGALPAAPSSSFTLDIDDFAVWTTTAAPDPVPPAPAPVASVVVAPGTASVTAGQSAQLAATTYDSAGSVLTGRGVSWVSSNPSVASVSATGAVTGVAAGSATITATSEGKSGTASISVSQVPVASVSVSLAAASLQPGATTQATATARDASSNVLSGRAISWSSSNTAVATVSASGVVTAVAQGSANIVATVEGKTGSAALTVNAPAPVPVATVTVGPSSVSVQPGQTAQLTATTRDASGNVLAGRSVTWTTSNPGIATVSASGVVSGVAAGSATVTATSEGKSGSSSITVNAPPPPSAKVDTIFYDGFESGSLSAWTDGVDASKHTIVTNSAYAAGGSRALKVSMPAGGDGGWLTHWFMPGYDSAYVRIYARWENDFNGGDKLLALRGSRIDDAWSAYGKAGVCPNGTDFFGATLTLSGTYNPGPMHFYNYYPGMSSSGGCWGDESGSYTHDTQGMSKGVYHKIEFWLKLNTINNADAFEQFWVDGVLWGTKQGFRYRTTSDLRVNSVQLTLNATSSSTPRTMYIDEVLVTKQKPQ